MQPYHALQARRAQRAAGSRVLRALRGRACPGGRAGSRERDGRGGARARPGSSGSGSRRVPPPEPGWDEDPDPPAGRIEGHGAPSTSVRRRNFARLGFGRCLRLDRHHVGGDGLGHRRGRGGGRRRLGIDDRQREEALHARQETVERQQQHPITTSASRNPSSRGSKGRSEGSRSRSAWRRARSIRTRLTSMGCSGVGVMGCGRALRPVGPRK